VFSVAYSLRFIHDVFYNGEPVDLPKYPPHEPPRYMKIPVEILVALCVAVGVFPALIIGPLLAAGASATLGGTLPEYHLAIWHGLNLPLLMSALALGGGVLVYSQRRHLFKMRRRWPDVDANRVFEGVMQCGERWARAFSGRLRSGSLQGYIAWLLGLVAVVMLVYLPPSLLAGRASPLALDGVALVGASILIVAALLAAALPGYRMMAIIAVSVVGLMVSLIFVRFSAPDLALTQLCVEVVTVLLLMLAMYFLPARGRVETGGWRVARNLFLALVIGAGVGLMAFVLMTSDFDSISPFFLDHALPGGGGANVVNVILVDFRGFDTFGEISVLGIAGIGIYALLQGLKLEPPATDAAGRPWGEDTHPMLLVVMARPMLPLALLVSMYIFLRGHNLPGGGFIAGLITSVAILLQYVASGVAWVQPRLPGDYHPLLAAGLLLAGLTGLGSWLFGYPFLTSTFGHFHWPLVGEFELASAMLFDAGVFLTVVGATLLILANLSKLILLEDKPGGGAWKP
jgi:multicomponent K+:H+ antiporter subunit A